jgi:hypothetical protein
LILLPDCKLLLEEQERSRRIAEEKRLDEEFALQRTSNLTLTQLAEGISIIFKDSYKIRK